MRLAGIFLIILTISSLSIAAFDNHSTIKSQSCESLSLTDCDSHTSAQSQQNPDQKEHTHCAVHCAPLLLNGLLSNVVFSFFILEDTKTSIFSFVINTPILEGPFKPPQV